MRAPPLTQKRARSLRRALSPPEAMLWARIRKREPGRPAFRRQHPVGPYILDFYCAAHHLAVEIDGDVHGAKGRSEHDERRDAWLRDQGIEVMRIPAAEVFHDPDAIAAGLLALVANR